MAAGRKTGGRKAGTPNKATVSLGLGKTITQIAQERAPGALNVLFEIAEDKNAPPSARVSAANSILDRAYGRVKEAVPDGQEEAPSLNITINAAAPIGQVRVTRFDT